MVNFQRFIFDKRFLFVIYLILVGLFSFCLQSVFYIFVYLSLVFLLGWFWFFSKKPIRIRFSKWWIIFALVLVLFFRILPFAFSPHPLGYDTGLYKKSIENFAQALPNLPHFLRGAWDLSQPWGLFLSTDLLSLVGLSSGQILYGYYIFLNLLLTLSIFILVRRFFGTSAAICSLFIFALSTVQFQAYWMMYYKNIAGLFLMLMAFWLLSKKSYWVIPVAALLGGLHRPSFLIFGLSMLAHFVFNKDKKYHIVAGISILAIALPLYIHNIQPLMHYLSPNLGKMAETFGFTGAAGAGTFFDFQTYLRLVALYLPFGILGLIYLARKKRFNYLFFYFLFSFSIVYFHLIFFKRFIIFLDIGIIVLAGIALSYIVSRLWLLRMGRIIVFVLILGGVCILGVFTLNTRPLIISKEELAEIKSLASAKDLAFIIASRPYYNTWAYGFSQRRVITPGLFTEYDKWNKTQWQTFWSTSNQNLRHRLLDEYQAPIYFYMEEETGKQLFLGDPKIKRASKRIWRYK